MSRMENTDELKKRIKELEEEVKRLRKVEEEYKEFKAKHTQTVSELRKALKIKASKKKEPKQSGAKSGHKAYFRRIPERIDYIKTHNPKKCSHCKTKLGATQEVRSRYVTDIKLIGKVKNTRHDIHRKYCPKCKKIVEPEVPDVLPHASYQKYTT